VAGACALGAIAVGIAVHDGARRDAPRPAAIERASAPASPTAPAAREEGNANAATPPADVASPLPPAQPARPAAPKPAPDPTAELRLLERAQQALRADPARALVFAEEHRQRFARGQFAQEREMIAIEALVSLGQSERAATRARAFARRYPDSSHLPHLRDLVHTTP
jgi:hypothetical protein